jgi:hypothetical protein
MMGISLAGLIGAIVGTVVAAVNYHLFIGVLEHRLRGREQSQTAEERDHMDKRMSLIRRVVFTVDLFVFAGVGYWLGHEVWG